MSDYGQIRRRAQESFDALPDYLKRNVILPAENATGCTCDRDDDSWVGERPLVMCALHERRLRHLSWDTLACMVIDYEAALRGSPAAEETDHE